MERVRFKSLSCVKIVKASAVSHWTSIIIQEELGACLQKGSDTWKEKVCW